MTPPVSDQLYLRSYFFDQGIAFECQQCGACCTGASGTIYISGNELQGVSQHMGLLKEDFIDRFCYPFKDSYSIGEDRQGRCLLFDNGCTIYPVRPLQCRTYPFWFSNMRSRERWLEIVRQCPGIGRGQHHSRDQILTSVQRTMHI